MGEKRGVCPAEGENIAKVLASALQQMLQLARWPGPRIGVPIPTYTGYSDKQSANDFLLGLRRYELASDLSESEILRRIIPGALVDQTARWYQLAGHTAGSIATFRRLFREEFLPYDYKLRMRRELELRTQAPDESLAEFVRACKNCMNKQTPELGASGTRHPTEPPHLFSLLEGLRMQRPERASRRSAPNPGSNFSGP